MNAEKLVTEDLTRAIKAKQHLLHRRALQTETIQDTKKK